MSKAIWTRYSVLAALAGLLVCWASMTGLAGDTKSAGARPIWPLPDRTDFSSGYGDFRPGRFHYGLDLRTGDNRLPVVAPVDGHIAQIWVSYFGYGKALYLAGADGQTYVFGHLSGYAPFLQSVAQERQYAKERYFIREWFKPGEYPVKQGDTIAFTGKTGIGAPHLHFETRDGENIPRSPLRQGLAIKDKRGPVFEAVTFEYLDHGTVFENGLRRRKIRAEFAGTDANGSDHYTLDIHPFVSREFGMIVQARDYPTNKKFSASPYRLTLSIMEALSFDAGDAKGADGVRVSYEVTLDSLSYSDGDFAFCVYEQGMARNGSKDAYLLFDRTDGAGCLSGSGSGSGFSAVTTGRFPVFDSAGVPSLRYGVYPARITAVDASGNVSTLNFNFCYGPPGNLYRLTDISAKSALVTPLDPDELDGPLLFGNPEVIEVAPDGSWTAYKKAQVDALLNGAYRIKIDDLKSRSLHRVLRLRLYGVDGWTKNDLVFSNVPLTDRIKLSLDYQVADNGVYVTAKTSSPTTQAPIVRALRTGGDAVDVRLRQVGSQMFRGRLAPETCIIPVTGFAAYHTELATSPAAKIEGLYLFTPAGQENEKERLALKNGTVFVPRTVPGELRTLEIRDYDKSVPLERSILAGPFYLGPEDFIFSEKVKIGIGAVSDPALNIAICKLNKKGDRWDWFDTEFSIQGGEGVFWAESGTPGVYALLQDREAPEVSFVRPLDGGILKGGNQRARVKIRDDLSAIWSDTLFDVRIDGEWVIPEYDAEDHVLTTAPRTKLSAGKHTLTLVVTDNAGNTVRRRVNFTVKQK